MACCRRPVMTTFAPSAANSLAIARPMPHPPPDVRDRCPTVQRVGDYRTALRAGRCGHPPSAPVEAGVVPCPPDLPALEFREDGEPRPYLRARLEGAEAHGRGTVHRTCTACAPG